jgi:hypothetical protein
MSATTTSTRTVTSECGCLTVKHDHRDGDWTWSTADEIKVCDTCARQAAERTAQVAAQPAPAPVVEDWEATLLGSVASAPSVGVAWTRMAATVFDADAKPVQESLFALPDTMGTADMFADDCPGCGAADGEPCTWACSSTWR